MTSPESRDESFRNALLQSAADDGPAPAALDRELARLGLATAAGTAALTAASGATAKVGAASLLSTTLAKVTIVATIAVIGAAGYVAARAPTSTIATATTATTATATATATAVPAPIVATPIETASVAPASVAPAPVAPAPVAPAPVAPVAPAHAKDHVGARPATSAAVAEELTRTLAAEVALVDRARTLARSSPGEAMTALDEYARTFPGGTLRDEAAVVRVEALLAAGHRADAERTAQPYLRDRPNTPIARRMTDLLGPKKDPIP